MPPATIDEAETAFVRRRFVRSLRMANSILESGCSIGGEPGRREVHPAAAEAGGDAAAADTGDVVICCPLALVPGPSPNRSRLDVVTVVPATASSSPRSATDPPPLDTSDASSSSWRVRLTDASSVYDRAAAIVIQSIYEIDKSADGQMGGGSSNHADVRKRRNEHMFSDLSTLHRYYCDAPMPIGLACIYIQFCATMGWRGLALTFAVDILGRILKEGQPDRGTGTGIQEELLAQDWFLDACEELIDLALTELLPRVQEGRDCRDLLYRLQGQDQLDHLSKAQSIPVCEEVQPSSVDVLMRTLADDHSSSALHPCFEEIFEQCNEKLGQMLKDRADTPSDDSSKVDSATGLISAADNILARSNATASSTDTSDDHAHQDPPPSISPSLSELFQSNIVEPLWESEDRWTNRAAVVAVGVSSVMIWRRRKRIGAAIRSTGHAAVAPFREILEAIPLPQSEKR